MGKGQRSQPMYSNEIIEAPQDAGKLASSGVFQTVPASSSSLLGHNDIEYGSVAVSAPAETKVQTAPKELPHEKPHEVQDIPFFTLMTTYMSFLLLVVLAHFEDFFGKIFMPKQYVQVRVQNGYAPMVSDFESMWSRHVYARMRDCFNRPIGGVAGGHVELIDRVTHDYNKSFQFTGKLQNVLNLASYNYLGFAQSEGPCADKVEEAMREHGIAQASSRIETGCSKLLVETEEMVARFMGTEAAIIVSMGYATNSLTMPSLVSKGCLIISDDLNHSSLIAGSRLSGAVIRVFRHNDTRNLEKQLRRSISQGQPRTHRPWKKIMVVVEGLYSMEGEFCNLHKLIEMRNKYKFYLFVDEAHSIGALGKRGRGICDHFNVDPREIDILMGTFTKSFGAAGGYIAGSKALIDHLRVNSYAAVYSEAMSVPVLAQVSSSMRMIMGEDREHALEGQQRLDQLALNSKYFAKGLRKLGFMILGDPGSPIVPLLLFNPAKMSAFSRECLKRNIAVVVVSYPATPIIAGRVRFCISASHTREDLDYALEQVSEIGDMLMLKFHKDVINQDTKKLK